MEEYFETIFEIICYSKTSRNVAQNALIEITNNNFKKAIQHINKAYSILDKANTLKINIKNIQILEVEHVIYNTSSYIRQIETLLFLN